MPSAPALAKFQQLITDIARIYESTRQAQVRAAWEIGRRIVEVEQDGAVRAAYGSKLIPKLSETLREKCGPGFSETPLRKMRQFYCLHPIQPVTAELDWTDYVELLPVKDEKTRRRLEQRVLKEGLKSNQIRQLVHKIRHSAQEPTAALSPLKRPADLKLHTFAKSDLQVRLKDSDVLIDCGFFVNWPVPKSELANLDITTTPSYTYSATIDRVIDGDTLLVLVEVGFGIIMRDKLRLRGIDCAELGTPEGEKARRFVTKLLPVGSTVVLKSHKTRTDTYGRFVADVFYKEGVDDPGGIVKDGVYLNQQLLDEGYAVRMAE